MIETLFAKRRAKWLDSLQSHVDFQEFTEVFMYVHSE